MPNRNFRYHRLLNGILLSVVLHGFVLLIFGKFLTSTATVSHQGTIAKIEALLVSARQLQAPSANPVVASGLPEALPRLQRPLASPVQEIRAVRLSTGVVSNTQVLEPEHIEVSERSGAQEGAVSAPKPAEPIPVSQDGLREYRLNLGREARRYKRYPAMARERGLQGVVVIVVSTTAGITVPQVSLSHSSGHSVLDAQALEMAVLAVRFANLPESLRGRDFALDLPIRFSLEE